MVTTDNAWLYFVNVNFWNGLFGCLRHWLMGYTRVVCIGYWLTSSWRGSLWLSFCAQKETKQLAPLTTYWEKKSQGIIPISNGQMCMSLHKSVVGLMLQHLTVSSHGANLPRHQALSYFGDYWMLMKNAIWYFLFLCQIFLCALAIKCSSLFCMNNIVYTSNKNNRLFSF